MNVETAHQTGLEHISVTCSIDPDSGAETLTTVSEQSRYYLPLFTKNLSSKDWLRFITAVKGLIRSSYEYKLWVGQCKELLQLRNCSFLGDVDDESTDIEIHHAFLGLHDIVEIVADHLIATQGHVTSMTLCHEVMSAHYNGMVAIVPVSITVHELIHAGKIRVHYQQVYGDLKQFLLLYKKGVRPQHLEKLRKAIGAGIDDQPLYRPELLAVTPASDMDKLSAQIPLDVLSSYINTCLNVGEDSDED